MTVDLSKCDQASLRTKTMERDANLSAASAAFYFDKHTFTQRIHAVRSIVPGDEITISCKLPNLRSFAYPTIVGMKFKAGVLSI